MSAISNVIILPFKFMLLAAYIAISICVYFTLALEAISNILLGKLISLCLSILLFSTLLYEYNIFNSTAFWGIIIIFVFGFVISLTPYFFRGMQSWIKIKLLFWY